MPKMQFNNIHFEMFVPLAVNESEKAKQAINEFINTLKTKLMYEADEADVIVINNDHAFRIYVTLPKLKYVSYVVSELRKVNYKLLMSGLGLDIECKLIF